MEKELDKELAHYRARAFAANTCRTYRTHLKVYLDFCQKMSIKPVPVTERIVALYASYLARTLKPASIRQYLNIIRILHLESGIEHPFKDSWLVKSTLKGIEREKGCFVVRKAPMTPRLLLQIKTKLNLTVSEDAIFWAACLLMFFGLLRKSNLFAEGQSFDETKQLTRDCFAYDSQKNCLTVSVKWSKNNQCKERVQLISLPTLSPHPLCPVTAITSAFQKQGLRGPKALAFPLTSQVFSVRLKSVLGGRPDVTSHSFRRGGATWALENGVPGEIIKALGDWKSTAYLSYLDQIPQATVDYYRFSCFKNLPTE
jgi:hypothetical protein